MRIDFSSGSEPARETSHPRLQGAGANASRSAQGVGDDETQLSGTHVQVQALAAQAMQIPEIRQQRVQALREAIHSARYQPAREQVAAGIMSEMAGRIPA